MVIGYIAKIDVNSYIYTMTPEQIFEAALMLPSEMREELIHALQETFDPPDDVDETFLAELDRRIAEAEKDPSRLVSHDEVMRKARARLK